MSSDKGKIIVSKVILRIFYFFIENQKSFYTNHTVFTVWHIEDTIFQGSSRT